MNSYLFATFGLNPKYLLASQQSLFSSNFNSPKYFLHQSCTSKGWWTAFTGLGFDLNDSAFPPSSPQTHPVLSTENWLHTCMDHDSKMQYIIHHNPHLQRTTAFFFFIFLFNGELPPFRALSPPTVEFYNASPEIPLFIPVFSSLTFPFIV